MADLRYFCDNKRHLVCLPYTVANLHQMAETLGIKRCWFYRGDKPHYDIPKARIGEIQAKCEVVSPRHILQIIQGLYHEESDADDTVAVNGLFGRSGSNANGAAAT